MAPNADKIEIINLLPPLQCEIDLRKDFFKQIVLSGGSTMYPGLPTRLEKEISNLVLTRNFKGDKAALKKFKLKVEVK